MPRVRLEICEDPKQSEHSYTIEANSYKRAIHDPFYNLNCSSGSQQEALVEHRAERKPFGEATMKLLFYVAVVGCLIALASAAQARTAYDGSWDLVFVTKRGGCDPTYNFSVNISNGFVTHPNLVKFRGHVANSGAVRASVAVHDKYAAGSGRLSSNSGHGTWSGYSGSARCSGYWSAQRS